MAKSIIGIDCATDPTKAGMAHGHVIDSKLTTDKVLCPQLFLNNNNI
ncbi:MAG: hypothetical protein ACC650_07755 [Gammaproteobacteria bacterium]